MRVALITAASPFEETAGAERTLTWWLSHLSESGFNVDVLTYGTPSNETVAGCNVHRFDDKCPVSAIEQYCDETTVDVVLTQAGWGDIALWAAERHDIPTLLCVMSDFDLNLMNGIAAEAPPTRAVAVSNDYRDRAAEIYDCSVRTVYQPIDFDYYTVDNVERKSYTMVNPVDLKGGNIFGELAKQRPKEKFLAKMGWMHQRNEDFSFDQDIYDIYSRTVNGYVQPPEEPNLSDIPNLEFVKVGDIRDIYRQTKVLLVPSQWEESFGRVVIEAMHNGIPVVASNIGGIPEACGDAAMLVDEYESVDVWNSRLDELADEDIYNRYIKKGRERAKEYREQQPQEIKKFETEVKAAADR